MGAADPSYVGVKFSDGTEQVTNAMMQPVVQPQSSSILLPYTNVASAAAVPSVNVACYAPIFIPTSQSYSGLCCHVTAASVGGTSPFGRMALLNDNGSGTSPGTLIFDTGAVVVVTSTGLKVAAHAFGNLRGLYWVGWNYSFTSGPTTAPQLTSFSTVIPLPGPAMNSINYRCLQEARTGAFASNPTAAPSSQVGPVVGLIAT